MFTRHHACLLESLKELLSFDFNVGASDPAIVNRLVQLIHSIDNFKPSLTLFFSSQRGPCAIEMITN
jgi:hypothetical protein